MNRIARRHIGAANQGMGMGIREENVPAIDTFGLQEYFITDIAVETAGNNVRMICGVRRGGHVHWLYSCVMPAELLIPATRDCARIACESFNMEQLMDVRGKGH